MGLSAAVLLPCLLCGVAEPEAADSACDVRFANGDRAVAQLVEIIHNKARLRLKAAPDSVFAVELKRIQQLTFHTRDRVARRRDGELLLLRDGSLLIGKLRKLSDRSLVLVVDARSSIELPHSVVRYVLRLGKDAHKTPAPGKDYVVVGADSVVSSGPSIQMTDGALVLGQHRRQTRIPYESVSAIYFPQPKQAPATATATQTAPADREDVPCTVTMLGGSILRGSDARVKAGRLRLGLVSGVRVDLPLAKVVSIILGHDFALDLGDGVRMAFVSIPPGVFTMGSADGEAHERPPHPVQITRGFYLGKYEVTQAEWSVLLNRNPSAFKGPDLPVDGPSWDQCQEFIEKLSQRFPDYTFRLPTEAEWEYACRAGSNTRFSFGDDEAEADRYAWYADNAGRRPHPGGQRKPNAWGLYDMHGNLYEWCHDRYGPYPRGLAIDPKGPEKGGFRVCRGGSWKTKAEVCSSPYRSYLFQNYGYFNEIGLRIVCVPGPPIP